VTSAPDEEAAGAAGLAGAGLDGVTAALGTQHATLAGPEHNPLTTLPLHDEVAWHTPFLALHAAEVAGAAVCNFFTPVQQVGAPEPHLL